MLKNGDKIGNKCLISTDVKGENMNNFDKIRTETATIEGMAKMFLSSDW